MGKFRNRKKTQFKRGNIPHNKGIRFPKSDKRFCKSVQMEEISSGTLFPGN